MTWTTMLATYSTDFFEPSAATPTVNNTEHAALDSGELNRFLAETERRAFRSVFFAVKHEDDALDIVQDSMLKFASHYSARPAAEWPLLLQRILQNGIKDHFRRQKVRNRWTVFIDQLRPAQYIDNADDLDPLETLADQRNIDGESALEQEQNLSKIETVLAALPLRQQQAFLLRSWEGLSTRDTAAAMGCSEGSVKTHYFRAMEQLKSALSD